MAEETARDVAIVIPSRGRPEQAAALVDRLYEMGSTWCGVVVAVDVTDPTLDAYRAALRERVHVVAEPAGHVAALNAGTAYALELMDPELVIKLDDDHWPWTSGWDGRYLEAMRSLDGTGVVYGDDGYQRERLATAVGISSNIIRALGHFAPPIFRHLYCDNWWTELGRHSGQIRYLPGVYVEHMHPAALRAPLDDTYRAGGENEDNRSLDRLAWEGILDGGDLERAVETVRRLVQEGRVRRG